MHRLTAAQLANYLNVTKRSIQRRAVKEVWPYVETKGLGGPRREYHFTSLPLTVQCHVKAQMLINHSDLNLKITEAPNTKQQESNELTVDPFLIDNPKNNCHWVTKHVFHSKLDQVQLTKEYLEKGLVSLAKLYVAEHDLTKIKGFDEFCQQYEQQGFAINQQIYTQVKSLSRITLLRWEKKARSNQA